MKPIEIMQHYGMPPVLIDSHDNFDKCRWEFKAYLAGFEDRFVFAGTVTDRELAADPFVRMTRIHKVRDILIADWERAGKPNP
jgi:hypothetical protein